jgi:segregation and condensation protein A
MVTRDYTVSLEQVFNGPMDLLLHLVREQEVDIHEIDLHRVIEGYLGYLKDLQEIDIELAADFLVMAATLMAIKSRSLLPSENVDLAEELDPRDELIQRLIEYRHFKQASRELQERFDARARIHGHGFQAQEEGGAALDLSELSQWDLLTAFSRLMRETLANKQMVITSDERPLRYYVERLVGAIKERRTLTLREIVDAAAGPEGASKPALIGTFCALLELVKLGAVRAWQPAHDGEITITLREELGDDVDSIVRMTEFDDEKAPEEPPPSTEPTPAELTPESAQESDSATGDSADEISAT